MFSEYYESSPPVRCAAPVGGLTPSANPTPATTIKTTRNTLTTMLLLGLFLAAPTQAQTPRLAAWHSHRPMNMNREACFTRAQQALRAASFQNILTQEGWNTSGTSTYLHAAISCVAMGDQTLVDVVVAGADAYNSQTAAMRTRLSNYMINGVGSGGQLDPPSDNVSNWKIDYGPYEINGTQIDAKPAGDGKTSYYVAPERPFRTMEILFHSTLWIRLETVRRSEQLARRIAQCDSA